MRGSDELVLHHLALVGLLDHIQDHLLLHLFLLSLECARAALGLGRLPHLLLTLLFQSCHLWMIALKSAGAKLVHTGEHHVLISGFH